MAKKNITNQINTIASIVEEPSYNYSVSNPISKYMGGNWSSSSNSDLDYINKFKQGFKHNSLEKFLTVSGLTKEEIAKMMHVSERTLRRYTANTNLGTEQSERLYELAKLYSRGELVLGSLENFKKWVNKEVFALGNKKPIEFMDTSMGIQLLLNILGRIEYGVYS